MLTTRLRSLFIAVLGGAALAAAVLATLAGQPGRAQAANAPGSSPALARPATTTLNLYLPLVVRMVPPCSVAPLLLTPTNQSQLDNLIPVISYFRQTDAVSLTRLQLATGPGFSPEAVDITSSGGGPGLVTVNQFHNLQPGTTYYWRAQDFCMSGPGPFSPVFTFTTGSIGAILTAPQLISPTNGAMNTGGQVTFSWTGVGDALGYQFWIQTANGSNNLYFVDQNTKVQYGLLAGVTYTWYVQAYNTYAYGTESEHWSFGTGVLAPSRPAGRAPESDLARVVSWLRGGARLAQP